MLLHFRGLGFRATVKLSAVLFHDESSIRKGGGGYESVIASTKFSIFMFSGRGKSPRPGGSNVYT